MWCNRCKKRILKGDKFVEIGSDKPFYAWIGWTEQRREEIRGKKVFCPPCAKKERRRRKKFWKDFFWFNAFVIFVILFGAVIVMVSKASKK